MKRQNIIRSYVYFNATLNFIFYNYKIIVNTLHRCRAKSNFIENIKRKTEFFML